MGVKFCSSFAFLALLTLILLALPLKSNAGGIAVYWGQNATGDGKLIDTCKTKLYSFVNLAFLYKFGNGDRQNPQLNLAGHCNPRLGECRKLSKSIKICQNMGIKVMLSIGGGTNTYSLSSADEARGVADYLWTNFLGGNSNFRPLGDAVLDGIDFDIESGAPHYKALAMRLREHDQQSGRKVYLTAAPQCRFPDKLLNGALSTGLFDYVWIQFYNNPECEFDASNPNNFQQSWKQWTSQIRAGQFFVGLPASRAAAVSGFVPSQTLINQVLPFVNGSGQKYGGVMLWDRANDARTGYGYRIHSSV